VNPTITTLLFEIANFLVFALLLGWLLFKPVRNWLAAQQAQETAQAEKALQALADAEKLRGELASARKQFAAEQETLIKSAIASAKKEADQLLDETRQQIARERTELQQQALQMEEKQVEQLTKEVANTARDMVARLLQTIDGPELERALRESAIAELRNLNGRTILPVTVDSARELCGEFQADICRAMHVEPEDDNVHFRVAPELIGGIRITTESGLIDHSISGLANFANQALRDSLARHAYLENHNA